MALYEETPENVKRIFAVAERLLGTASSVDDALCAEFGDDDLTIEDFSRELLQHLDEEVEECRTCGFWAESGAMEDEECEDCRDDD